MMVTVGAMREENDAGGYNRNRKTDNNEDHHESHKHWKTSQYGQHEGQKAKVQKPKCQKVER